VFSLGRVARVVWFLADYLNQKYLIKDKHKKLSLTKPLSFKTSTSPKPVKLG